MLAFAVGLGAGHVHRRRRRAAAPRPSRAERRAAAHAPPPPAPPPPEPVQPAAPVVLAAPVSPVAPVPPPPQSRPAKPRALRPSPTPAPPPPKPPKPAAARARRARLAVQAAAAARGTGAARRAAEVPRPQDVDPAQRDRATPPLDQAPEALRSAQPSRPQPQPQPQPEPELPGMTPARRFARLVPWPEEAVTLWTCEIDWKPGYRRSTFRAIAEPPGAGKRRQIGESPPVRWTLMSDPEPPTPALVAAVRPLMAALEAAGWQRIGPAGRGTRSGSCGAGRATPGPSSVPDTAQAAERPSG